MSNKAYYNQPGQEDHEQHTQYFAQNQQTPLQGEGQQTGERSLLGNVAGAAVGGYAGSKLSGKHNILGGIAGAIGGAVLAHKAENAYERHQQKEEFEHQQQYQPPQYPPQQYPPQQYPPQQYPPQQYPPQQSGHYGNPSSNSYRP